VLCCNAPLLLILLALIESCSAPKLVMIDIDVSSEGMLSAMQCNLSSDTVFVPKFEELSDRYQVRYELDTLHVQFPCSEVFNIQPKPARCPPVVELQAAGECRTVFSSRIRDMRVLWIRLMNFGEIGDLTIRVPGSAIVELPPIVVFKGGLPGSVTVR